MAGVSANSAVQLNWQLETNGLYTIVVEDYFLTDTGNYNITFLDQSAAVTSASNPYGGSIASAQTTNGNIQVSSDLNAFQISGQVGNRIIINVTDTSGNLHPNILLYNPQGVLETSAGVSASSAAQLDWQLKTNGLYTIVIEDYFLTDSGNYNITFIDLAAAITSSSNPYGGSITSAQTTNGNIQVSSDLNGFQIYGQMGNGIIINITDTNGNLHPNILLYNPQGVLETSAGVSASSAAQLDWQLKTNGLYTIVVEDYFLTDTSNYKMTFSIIPGAPTSMSNPYGGIITSGESTNGFILSPSDLNEFQVYGSLGQQAQINVTDTSGNLHPNILLYNPQGSLEASAGVSANSAVQLNWQLETNGLYTIVVEDYFLTDTGKFNLSFSTIPPITNPGLYNPSPSLGQTLTSLPATLSWSAVSGATNYNLYFGLGVTNVLQQTGTNFAADTFAFPSVATQTVYYWQVVANAPSGSIQGPYWWFNVVSANPPPVVTTGISGANKLIFSWPAVYSSFTLQTTTNLSSGNWVTVTNPFTTIGSNIVVTNNISGNSGFFRLMQ